MNLSFWKRAFVSPVGLCACLSLGLASSSLAGTFTSNSGAFDAGAGINVRPARTGPYLYLEARYMRGFTSNSDTSMVPIVFGVRW